MHAGLRLRFLRNRSIKYRGAGVSRKTFSCTIQQEWFTVIRDRTRNSSVPDEKNHRVEFMTRRKVPLLNCIQFTVASSPEMAPRTRMSTARSRCFRVACDGLADLLVPNFIASSIGPTAVENVQPWFEYYGLVRTSSSIFQPFLPYFLFLSIGSF